MAGPSRAAAGASAPNLPSPAARAQVQLSVSQTMTCFTQSFIRMCALLCTRLETALAYCQGQQPVPGTHGSQHARTLQQLSLQLAQQMDASVPRARLSDRPGLKLLVSPVMFVMRAALQIAGHHRLQKLQELDSDHPVYPFSGLSTQVKWVDYVCIVCW